MVTIILVFLGGIGLGYGIRARAGLLRRAAGMSDMALYALLFILGLSLGLDRNLMTHLPHIGRNALFLALGAILGSLGCCYALSRCFSGKK